MTDFRNTTVNRTINVDGNFNITLQYVIIQFRELDEALNAIYSTAFSIVVGALRKTITSKIKARSLIKIGDKNIANRILGKMGVIGKMGKKNIPELSKVIRNSNWIGNIISDKVSSSIASNTISRLYDALFKS